jgi:hypothetical protein
MNIMKAWRFEAGAALVLLAAGTACADNTGRLSFSVASRTGSAPAANVAAPVMAPSLQGSCAAGQAQIALGTDQICLTRVDLVLRRIELQRVEVATCDAVPDNGDCEEFETGPILLTLPPFAVTQVTVKDVPNGIFDKLEFEIHKPDPSNDGVFIATLPQGFPSGVSIRVQGFYNANAQPFDFQTDLDAGVEVQLNSPLTVSGGTANIDLQIDLSSWFKNGAGTGLVDPASANKGFPNESLVANNIKTSFHGFEDDNKDGQPDH